MSSGLYVGDSGVSGSNGAVEVLVTALRRQAEARFGPADPLASLLGEYEETFPLTGRGVYLDEALTGPDARRRFREVLDAAVADLLAGDEYSESGREWLRSAAGWFADRLDGPTASTAPPP